MPLDRSPRALLLHLVELRDDLARACVFLTRLPVRWPETTRKDGLARALRLAPLVGAGLGLVAGAVYCLASAVGLPPLAASGLALLFTFCLTGGLHEDGLADVADGLGGNSVKERLAIMRDSRVGSYGVAAIALSLLLRGTALAALSVWPDGVLALIGAHALSRAVFPAAMRGLLSARPGGLGEAAGRPSRTDIGTALGLGFALALAALGPVAGLLALIVTSVAVGLGAWLAARLLGGYTGDVLGALQQLAEISVLLTAAAILGS